MDGVSGYKLYLCENSNTDSWWGGSWQGLPGALPALEQDSWDRVVLDTEIRVTHPEGQAATQASRCDARQLSKCLCYGSTEGAGSQVRHT